MSAIDDFFAKKKKKRGSKPKGTTPQLPAAQAGSATASGGSGSGGAGAGGSSAKGAGSMSSAGLVKSKILDDSVWGSGEDKKKDFKDLKIAPLVAAPDAPEEAPEPESRAEGEEEEEDDDTGVNGKAGSSDAPAGWTKIEAAPAPQPAASGSYRPPARREHDASELSAVAFPTLAAAATQQKTAKKDQQEGFTTVETTQRGPGSFHTNNVYKARPRDAAANPYNALRK